VVEGTPLLRAAKHRPNPLKSQIVIASAQIPCTDFARLHGKSHFLHARPFLRQIAPRIEVAINRNPKGADHG
jgi:hypothetical protein